jgi:hypothetical protein
LVDGRGSVDVGDPEDLGDLGSLGYMDTTLDATGDLGISSLSVKPDSAGFSSRLLSVLFGAPSGVSSALTAALGGTTVGMLAS